jgi:DNA-binding transcriptional MerR regulator
MIKKPEFLIGWLNTSEVASALSTSCSTIERWAEEGVLPKPERFHRWNYWKQQDIDNIQRVTYCR